MKLIKRNSRNAYPFKRGKENCTQSKKVREANKHLNTAEMPKTKMNK